jgi:hypothetical protein
MNSAARRSTLTSFADGILIVIVVKQERAERERANAANVAADQRVAELESDLTELARATSTAADAFEKELARVTKENAELKTKQAQLEDSRPRWPN